MSAAAIGLANPRTDGDRVKLRSIDWIWNVRGSVPIPPGQSAGETLDRLAPLFEQPGTTHETTADALTFRKKDQAAQDKLSVFDSGELRIDRDARGPVLRYRLVSRALLFCFMLPLLFLGFAGLTIGLNHLQAPSAKAAKAEKPKAKKTPDVPMNPIDKALGAPAPEKKKDKDKKADDDKNPTPTAAYVFAGIFALLYVVGRVLEASTLR